MIYDKRAYDEVYPDLSVLAKDALAVLTYFQNRPEVKNDAVGFSGGSQAAWLATSVASQPESKVAFIIMSGWPAVTPGEQELQSKENKLRAADITSAELRDALAYMNLYFYVAHTGQMWDELSIAAQTSATTKWGELVPIPNQKTELGWWSRNHDFPMQQHLQKVKCPVLACYGKNDAIVPPSRNAERLRKIMTQSGNNDVTISIFDDGDHRIEIPMIIDAKQVQWPQLSPDYFQQIESWLRMQQFSGE